MAAERNDRRIPGKSMKVRELLERLQQVDPEATVVVDAASGSLLILTARPRIHQEVTESGEPDFTAADLKFLRQLRIL